MDDLTAIYRKIDGQHVITSTDVDGLYVVGRNFDEAVESAEEAIPFLLEDNGGVAGVSVAWERAQAENFTPAVEDTPDYSSPGAGQRLVFRAVQTAPRLSRSF